MIIGCSQWIGIAYESKVEVLHSRANGETPGALNPNTRCSPGRAKPLVTRVPSSRVVAARNSARQCAYHLANVPDMYREMSLRDQGGQHLLPPELARSRLPDRQRLRRRVSPIIVSRRERLMTLPMDMGGLNVATVPMAGAEAYGLPLPQSHCLGDE